MNWYIWENESGSQNDHSINGIIPIVSLVWSVLGSRQEAGAIFYG